MESFLARYQSEIKGVLSGFDRIRFRGTIRWLSSLQGMSSFLGVTRVLLKDFTDWGKSLTDQIKQATSRFAEQAERPVEYLHSSQERKELRALEIAAADRVTSGLVCVLTCVEPGYSFKVGPNRALKKLELRYQPSKCLHQYFYWLHPQLGLTHLRLQTWLPLTVHVCLNGREWLARQLRAEGIPHHQRDNCFVDVGDMPRAQALLNRQLTTDWKALLNSLLEPVRPVLATLYPERPMDYYWSAEETEWATDVLFRSPEALRALYPRFIRHGITQFGAGDVLRFLGRRPSVQHFTQADLQSDLKTRPEGMRIKHRHNRNSIKMYDKQESVLRVETTVNDARDMKVYRASETDPEGPKAWRGLRKGVCDLPRRTQISQAANERYLEALAAVEHTEPLQQVAEPLSRPTRWNGRRVRALNPLGEDGRLLETVARGEFLLVGFRNRDLLPWLSDRVASSSQDRRRQSAKITRQLRMLRAHKLIRKVPRSHRYLVTEEGRTVITALLAARNADTRRLTELAA